MEQQFKRHIARKLKIGHVLEGKPIMENERLKAIEISNSQVSRINLVANVIDKFIQDGEKKFGSLTLDDGTGQIKAKLFGEDIDKFKELNMGDTLLTIGLPRSWNNEIYIAPEIIKKKEAIYLLLRKLEIEAGAPSKIDKEGMSAMKDKLLLMIKESEKEGGIEIEKIVLDLKEHPEMINQEIKRLLENGAVYEPRPGKLRYLGQ